MIHGQVATAWSKLLSIDEIVVINDEIQDDEMQMTLLELACPPGIELHICTAEEAFELIDEDELEGNATMLLFKTLKDAVNLVEQGYEMENLNIGGMYFEEGKKKYEKALCLDDEDEQMIRELVAKGIDVYYQVAPMNEKSAISKYIEV